MIEPKIVIRCFRYITVCLIVLLVLSTPLTDLSNWISAYKYSNFGFSLYRWDRSGLAAELLGTAGVLAVILLLSFLVRSKNMSLIRQCAIILWSAIMALFGLFTLSLDYHSLLNHFTWGEDSLLWAVIRILVALSFIVCMAIFILGYLYEFIQWLRKRGAT